MSLLFYFAATFRVYLPFLFQLLLSLSLSPPGSLRHSSIIHIDFLLSSISLPPLMLMLSQLASRHRFVFPPMRRVNNWQETLPGESCILADRTRRGRVTEARYAQAQVRPRGMRIYAKAQTAQFAADFPGEYSKFAEFQRKRHTNS